MNKSKVYLIIFIVLYAFAYYFFLRHLKLPAMLISAIPVVAAVIIISGDKRRERKKKGYPKNINKNM